MVRLSEFLILLSFFSGFDATFAASEFKSQFTFFEFSCKDNQHATGCIEPFERCALGKEVTVDASCLAETKNPSCPDFTWEKCCAANCSLMHRTDSTAFGNCVTECTSRPENNVNWTQEFKKKKGKQ